jgi:streptogrisin D
MRNSAVKGLVAALCVAMILAPGAVQAVPPEQTVAKDEGGTGPIDEAAVRESAALASRRSAANLIRWAVERGDGAGFTATALADSGVILWWKGALPEDIRQAVEEARRIAPVTVRSAAHSLAELEDASAKLIPYLEAHPDGAFHGVEIPADGSGLVMSADAAKVKTVQLAADRLAEVPSVGIPLTTVVRPRPRFRGRLNDSPPWYGGARMYNMDSARFRPYMCSTGFGVRDGSGRQYILTATHCATPPDRILDGARQSLGTASRQNWQHDVLLIHVSFAGGRIFDGGVGTGEFTKGFSGWNWTHVGDYLCQSPSVTGVLCGIRVTDRLANTLCDYDSDNDYVCATDLILARTTRNPAAAYGDSGGPVFALDGSRVRAVGTITGSVGANLYFQDFGTAWRDFGITPMTST